MKRLLPILLLAVLVVVPPGAAAAQETTTSTTSAPSTTLPEPAVPVVPAAPISAEAPWTWRFIIPTLLVVIVALTVGLGAAYYFRIKSRYRVVQ